MISERIWYQKPTVINLVLVPISWLFAFGVWLKNKAFDFGIKKSITINGAFLVSVGNLIAGGTGKTPFVIFLARWAQRGNKKVAILTRGYRRKSTKLISFVAPNVPSLSDVGDEARLLGLQLSGVGVYVCANRVRAAQMARLDGYDFLILDDGFQHRALHRDVDVVLDSTRGNGLRIPAGPLRESGAALKRAQLVIGPPHTIDLRSHIRFPSPVSEVLLLTGIARAERVRASLEHLKVRVVEHLEFPDHHPFTNAELNEAKARAQRLGVPIATTQKDAQRISGLETIVIEHRVEFTKGIEQVAQCLGLPLPP